MPTAPKKINGFSSPPPLPHVAFRNLINVRQLQHLLEVSHASTGMPTAIIDAETSEVYAGAGWKDICVHFHRAHPETLMNCIRSDTAIVDGVKDGKPHGFKCANGLWDIGIPIRCGEHHIATYFIGQFHYDDEPPPRDFFAERAERFGFDMPAYLHALDEVPRFPREKVQEILKHSVALAGFLSEMATQNMRQRQELILRTEAERQLHLAQSHLASVINSMPSLLVGVDSDGLVTFWNLRAQQETGTEERAAMGAPIEELLPQLGEDIGKIRAAINSGHRQEAMRRERQVGGQVRCEDVAVFPLIAEGIGGAVIRIDDVTERVQLERMMVQTEKMMSVGGLAAGMAHEINNPLASILVCRQNIVTRIYEDLPKNLSAAADSGAPLDAVRRYLDRRDIPRLLEMIRESGERAADIVSNMLRFSRKSEKHFGRHDVSALLDATLELIGGDYDLNRRYDFRQIEIVREYAQEPPLAYCEPTEIQQVFLNLLRNATEAMSGKTYSGDRPRITLKTGRDSRMVAVQIEDNGPGVDEATRKRVFEPFFTTKNVGQGTGLGLSVSYFIITDQHRGRMEVASEPGRWTRFTLMLPTEPAG